MVVCGGKVGTIDVFIWSFFEIYLTFPFEKKNGVKNRKFTENWFLFFIVPQKGIIKTNVRRLQFSQKT